MKVEDPKENYITGWIKSFRSIMKKGWYKRSEYFHLWHHILYRANHKEVEIMFDGKNITLKEGQFITGRKTLSSETGINESKIERILTFFEKNEQQIEQQKTNKNRIITVLSWEIYQQSEQQSEQQTNNKRTTTEQQVNTDNNVKNNKNVKKLFMQTAFKDFKYFEKQLGKCADEKYAKYDAKYYYEVIKDWSEANGEKKVDWLATARTFIRKDIEAGKAKYDNGQIDFKDEDIQCEEDLKKIKDSKLRYKHMTRLYNAGKMDLPLSFGRIPDE